MSERTVMSDRVRWLEAVGVLAVGTVVVVALGLALLWVIARAAETLAWFFYG